MTNKFVYEYIKTGFSWILIPGTLQSPSCYRPLSPSFLRRRKFRKQISFRFVLDRVIQFSWICRISANIFHELIYQLASRFRLKTRSHLACISETECKRDLRNKISFNFFKYGNDSWNRRRRLLNFSLKKIGFRNHLAEHCKRIDHSVGTRINLNVYGS